NRALPAELVSATVHLSGSALTMRYAIRAFSGLTNGESERPKVSNSNPTPGEPEMALLLPTPRSHFSTFAISDKKRPTSSGARRMMIFDSKRMGSPLNVDGSVRQKLCFQSSAFPAGSAMVDAKSSITLKIPQQGEWKAQACDIA